MLARKGSFGAGCMLPYDWLFNAKDVSHDGPYLEGAVFFQFACFGYGTPVESGFSHWHPAIRKVNAKADFVAALPKKLLSHPRGPIAYVGHLDVALLHGFDDPDNPIPLEGPWHPRIAPFKKALDLLLGVNPMASRWRI